MTGDLIPITYTAVGGQTIQTVNARQLHYFLEVGRDFSTWMKERIVQYGFVDGADYLLTETGEQLPSGTKYRLEYFLSLNMAKELAMVERNAKGKEARAYFIRCEERARQAPAAVVDLRDPRQMAAAALQLVEINTELKAALDQAQARVATLAPKAQAFDAMCESDGTYTLENAGRIIGSNGSKMGPRVFIEWMRNNGFLFHQDRVLVPYGKFVVQGLFKVKARDVDGKMRTQTYITPKGLAHFHRMLNPQGDFLLISTGGSA